MIEFIAEHVTSSVRELEGSIIKLLAFASLKHKDITIELAREALRDKIRSEEMVGARNAGPGTRGVYTAPPATKFAQHAALSVMTIQQMVAAEWGVTPDELVGAGRSRRVVEPRRIGMLLCHELLELSLREIGAAFGDRDSSTVLSALARAREDLEESAAVAERVARLRQMLPASGNAGAATAR